MIYKNNLKLIREEKGISQYSISEILELNKRVYGQYEREYTIMPIKHLNSVCNYLNISIDYVMNFTNQINYSNNKTEIDRVKSGERLKALRKENKMTQAKLASILETAPSVIGGYEKGRRLIATPFLYTICDKYKISADYLLGKIDNPKYLK